MRPQLDLGQPMGFIGLNDWCLVVTETPNTQAPFVVTIISPEGTERYHVRLTTEDLEALRRHLGRLIRRSGRDDEPDTPNQEGG